MSNHTRAPWRAIANTATWGIYDRDGRPIAKLDKSVFGALVTADNASLIAAAPDGLHAAGVAYLALLNLPQAARALPHVQHAMATLRDFIAKATNRTDEDTQAEYETSATLGAS